ncbi:hypothetical protein QBA57_21675 [Streptomyces scabiei]|uniref:hypothetical protein n=1 Tax=Streptomyces scabiei TaxID=1930 RepID=UPI000765F702|nr:MULTISPECIES: hypothetical protein [Streptomyces]MBP5862821.1 hypothetical protein [Streptomyces sp. LBUM 1484]MBP5868251.1 hypothetical protein [Streptomyces sp. LBUM 1485]MBP5930551.1 hypothetical protein [Streptomyces sp. LBUM 1479]MBP5876714.1 hypothetical protein [Streptomyces sp. LBUM 1477]MBP5884471.1 hypothetical protein [Streptomyces sp. LBUM 1487]
MTDLIPRALQWLRLLFAPGTGKRRLTRHRPYLCLHITAVRQDPHTPAPAPVPSGLPRHRSPYGLHAPIDGSASALVRPYLVAHDEEAALRQYRRLALVLAADFGVDLDQHLVGPRKAAA